MNAVGILVYVALIVFQIFAEKLKYGPVNVRQSVYMLFPGWAV